MADPREIRALYLSASGQLGGAETSLIELLHAVRAARPEWTMDLILGADGPLRPRVERFGIRTRVVAFPDQLAQAGDSGFGGLLDTARRTVVAASAAIGYCGRLRDAAGEIRPHLIHATGFKMQVLAPWCNPGRAPLIWHIHDYVGRRRLMSRLMRQHARFCALAIVNSRSVEEDFRRICPGLPTRTIYNAIDLERFSPLGTVANLDALASVPPADGAIRVGLLATYARWKGHLVFLRALALARRTAPELRGYIIGGPIYQTAGSQFSLAELMAEADSLGLAGHVGFAGFQADPAPVIRALDALVHASTEPEPFGMVIVEGMACGKPVIMSLAGGAQEIVQPGVNALVHHPGDVGSLADALVRVARDRAGRAALGAAGRERAEALCRPERLAGEVLAAYGLSSAGRALRVRENVCSPAGLDT